MSSGPGEWSSFKQATPETQDIAEKVTVCHTDRRKL